MIDYNNVKQTIATNLPDNNKQEITASKLRDTLNKFVDKVQETETGIESKVSANETNVTNLTGRVDGLAETVENLPGGDNKVNINTLNLIDQSKIKENTLITSSGVEQTGSWGAAFKCTGFIEVNHSGIICDSILIDAAWPSYVVYDKQKRFLRAIFENSVYSYQSGDEYVRLNLHSSSTQNQANYGDVLNPYTPYNPIEGYITPLGLAKASEVYTKQQSDENFLLKDSPILDKKVNAAYINLIDRSQIKFGCTLLSTGVERKREDNHYGYTQNYIPVSENFTWNSALAGGNDNTICVYDENKKLLRGITLPLVSGPDAIAHYEYQEGDAFIRVNFNYSAPNVKELRGNYGDTLLDYTPYSPIGGYITPLGLAKASEVYTKQQSDENFLLKDSPILDKKVNAAYINLIDRSQIKFGCTLLSTGVERKREDNHYGYTQNYIPVSENFTWNSALAGGNDNTICVYDENKKLLRGITLPLVSSGPDAIARYEYQEGDAFIRVNFTYKASTVKDLRGNYGDTLLDYTPYNPIQGYLSETETEISNLDTRVTNIENKTYSTPFLTGMFNNCICIGDGLTAGLRENVGDLKNYSYPATLKKLTNWEITNAASGGQTASGWMTNTVYGGASQHDFSQHDIAIIFLGQNQEDDNSYRTNMQAIIDLLKNANPLIRIFMLVRRVSTTGHWGIAQELANSNNIPLFSIYSREAAIDLTDTLYHKMKQDSSGYDTGYFNTLGYNALGKVVFSFINDYIGNHQNEFKNVGDSIDL